MKHKRRSKELEDDTALVRSGVAVILEPSHEWPQGYVDSFAGLPDDFERPSQSGIEKRQKLG